MGKIFHLILVILGSDMGFDTHPCPLEFWVILAHFGCQIHKKPKQLTDESVYLDQGHSGCSEPPGTSPRILASQLRFEF